jgi:hypothetical protein
MASTVSRMNMVQDILSPRYETQNIGEYIKYGNNEFDVFFKKNRMNVVLVIDKRYIGRTVMYKDIVIAYYKIKGLAIF